MTSTDEKKKKQQWNVGVLQMECNDEGDIQWNQHEFSRLVAEVCKNSNKKIDMILGPECAICGYSYNSEMVWSKISDIQGGQSTEQFFMFHSIST